MSVGSVADLFSDVLGFYALSSHSPWWLLRLKRVQHSDVGALPIHYKINVLLGLKVLYDRLAFCLTRSCDVDKVLRLVKEFFENLYRLRNEITMVYYEAVGG